MRQRRVFGFFCRFSSIALRRIRPDVAALQILICRGFQTRLKQVVATDFSVVILTLDEEQNLPNCLSSLKDLDCEIVVVDSGSNDRTGEIARAAGARVVLHEFETQAQQLNWALDNLPLHGKWMLRLDADECLSAELAAELKQVLSATPP